MKRFLALAMLIGGSTLGFVGCAEESKVEKKETITTPGGKEEIKTKTEDKKTGDAKENPPTTEAPK